MSENLDQNEIDALLNDDDQDSNQENGQVKSLSELEEDAIGEVSNISMGSAATALYGLLDQKVEITAPKVIVTQVLDLSDNYSRPCVVVDVKYVEGLEGNNQLILEQEDAAIITDLMMGGDGSDPSDELGELQLSAVSEAMNQMMGAAATSMSDFFEGNKINISPPEANLLEVRNDSIGLGSLSPEDNIVQVVFDMKIGDLIDSQIVQVMTIDFAKNLVDSLIKPVSDISPEPEKKEEAKQAESKTQTTTSESQKKQARSQPQQQASRKPASQQIRRDVEVQDVEFDDLDDQRSVRMSNELQLIYDVDLELTVRLGKTEMSIKEILELSPGSVIELDRLAGEAVDLLVNGKLIAKGEVVVIDENFGFRVTDIVSSAERIKKL